MNLKFLEQSTEEVLKVVGAGNQRRVSFDFDY